MTKIEIIIARVDCQFYKIFIAKSCLLKEPDIARLWLAGLVKLE